MFGKPNVYAMINSFRVRVKDAREQDRNHLAEVDFEIPLTFELAEDVLPAMARDLFEQKPGSDEWMAKPEILNASFNVQPALQLVEVKEDPNMPAMVRIAGVSIRKVGAFTESGAVFLEFTATWTLGDYERELVYLIKRLRAGVYLTCEEQAPTLDLGTVPEQQQGADVAVDTSGNVTSIKRGRRGRKAETTH